MVLPRPAGLLLTRAPCQGDKARFAAYHLRMFRGFPERARANKSHKWAALNP